jgi:hypothetical protein
VQNRVRVIALAPAVVALSAAALVAGCGDSKSAVEPETVTVTETDLGGATPVAGSFGDGTHVVGEDIEPGTYKTEGGSGCYWARLRSFSGELDAIIANDNASGRGVVTIAPSDAGFESSNCGTWSSGSSGNASGESTSYPEIAVRAFMESCLASNSLGVTREQQQRGCTCMIREFEKAFSLSEFLDEQRSGSVVETPQGKRIVRDCVAEVLESG